MNRPHITLALVSTYEEFGGYEEGGWHKEVGVVQMLANMEVSEEHANTSAEDRCVNQFREETDLTRKFRKAAILMGFKIKLGHEYDFGEDEVFDIVILRSQEEIDQSDYEMNWRAPREEVVLGSHIPLDCPYYC